MNALRYSLNRITVPTRSQFRSFFINTESTPNPHSMKFNPDQEVLPAAFGTGMYFQSNNLSEAKRSPLALKLFSVQGVKGVFLNKDNITITKSVDIPWHVMKPLIFSEILDFFSSGSPVIISGDNITDTTVLETDDEIVATIKELVETRIRPSVQEDGGDIYYEGFDPVTGIVKVRLAGSCVGCPSSSVTLRNGVEKMLMHNIPEVKGIEEVVLEAEEAL